MSEQADAPEREDDELLLEEPVEGLEPEVEEAEEEVEPSETDEPAEGEEPEGEFDDFTFGDEAAPASRGTDSDLVKHLRQEIRSRDEKLTAYERGEIPAAAPAIERKPKPTLEGCDYDADQFATELLAWNENERKADEVNARVTAQQQAFREESQKKFEAYGAGKSALKVPDFEVAEAAVLAQLAPEQQAAIIEAADDPAKMVYALGRHPEQLKALAAQTNPIGFIKALIKLEGQLKVTSARRTPPDPDRPQRGSAPLSRGTDRALERLEREAARTGDRTAVVRYKREQRQKAQGKS